MPFPTLDLCIPLEAQEDLSGRVFSSDSAGINRRVYEFDDPIARGYRFSVPELTEAQMLSVKTGVFDLVGFHGVFELTLPGEVSARKFRFEEFAPTKTAGNSYSLSLTMREALGV